MYISGSSGNISLIFVVKMYVCVCVCVYVRVCVCVGGEGVLKRGSTRSSGLPFNGIFPIVS